MKALLLALLRLYKRVISPLLPPACRFTPTCSEYAYDAVRIHGPVRGSAMAAGRICRCHPFHPGGYDPVPGSDRSADIGQQTPSALPSGPEPAENP